MNVLITSPSLDITKNVSGISSVVNNIVENSNCTFYHLKVGKEDNRNRNIIWIVEQLILPIRTFYYLIIYKIDLFHINSPLSHLAIVRDFILLVTGKLCNKLILLHIHGGLYLIKSPKNKFLKKVLIFYFSKADQIIVLSEYEKRMISEHYMISENRISVLENCVTHIKYLKKINDTNIVRIIFLGRIESDKGIYDILTGLKLLKNRRNDFEFYLYGEGSEKDKIIDEFSATMKNKFFYGGIVSGIEKDNAFYNANIFLLPSESEGLPIALLEAMSYGNIALVTDVGSVGTVIQHGYNGFFVKKNNPKDLFQKLDMIIDLIKDNKTSHISQNAVNTIEKQYNCIQYKKKLGNIYLNIISE